MPDFRKIFLRFSPMLLFVFVVSSSFGQVPGWDWIKSAYNSKTLQSLDVAIDNSNGDAVIVGSWQNDLSLFYGDGTRPSTDFSSSYGGVDGFVCCYNDLGDVKWAFKIGSPADDMVRSIAIDSNGDIYITGEIGDGESQFSGTSSQIPDSSISNSGNLDCFIAKYNSDGELIWLKSSLGSKGDVSGKAIAVNASSVFTVGDFESELVLGGDTIEIASSSMDIFLSKHDFDGNIQWIVAGGGGFGVDIATDVVTDNDDVYFTGTFTGNVVEFYDSLLVVKGSNSNLAWGWEDIFVAGYDVDGNFLWTTSIGSDYVDYGNGIEMDSDYVYLTGGVNDGAYFPAYAGNPISTEKMDAFFSRHERTNGETNWAKVIPSEGVNDEYGLSLSLDNSNNIYLSGVYRTNLDFFGDTILTAVAGQDIFLASFIDNGNFNWAKTGGSSASEEFGYSVAAGADGSIYLTGVYDKEVYFDSTALTDALNSDIFLAKLKTSCSDAVGGILSTAETDICEGESAALTLAAYSGQIIWQSSALGLNIWSNIPDEHSASITVLPIEDTDYRAYLTSDVCNPDSSNILSLTLNSLPISNAGLGGDACGLDFQLQASLSEGTGEWSVFSGPGNIVFTPSSNTSTAWATVDINGEYEIIWTVSNGICQDVDTVIVNFAEQPAADAGIDAVECDLDFQLQAIPSVGTGMWTKNSGPGDALFTPSVFIPNAVVTADQYGDYEFIWSETLDACSDSDTIKVSFVEQPIANAGSGGNVCGLEFQLVEIQSVGSGEWSMVSGPGNVSITKNLYVSGAHTTVDQYGSYDFSWTETNGSCSDADTITVIFFEQGLANAGSGGETCGIDFQLGAIPGAGTGEWSIVSGPGSAIFAGSSGDSDAIVTVDQYGFYELSWTEINGPCTGTDTVELTFYEAPVVSAALGGEVCGLSFFLEAYPSIGIGEWSLDSGPGNADFVSGKNTPVTEVIVDDYGTYGFKWKETNAVCSDSLIVYVNFYDELILDAGGGGDVCGLEFFLEATPAIGFSSWKIISGPGKLSFYPSDTLNSVRITVEEYGNYILQWNDSLGDCSGSDTVEVRFHEQAIANAGPDQILEFEFSSYLDALETDEGTGNWYLIEGDGLLVNENDPHTMVTSLSVGVNEFGWKIVSNFCEEVSDNVVISVSDLLTPTVITPNNDFLNDYLIFSGIENLSDVEIIIYNRWGAEVFRSRNYQNDWNGIDMKDRELLSDTYYYILKLPGGRIIKNFVEIRR